VPVSNDRTGRVEADVPLDLLGRYQGRRALTSASQGMRGAAAPSTRRSAGRSAEWYNDHAGQATWRAKGARCATTA